LLLLLSKYPIKGKCTKEGDATVYRSYPPENCHLNVKKFPKTYFFFYFNCQNLSFFLNCQKLSFGFFFYIQPEGEIKIDEQLSSKPLPKCVPGLFLCLMCWAFCWTSLNCSSSGKIWQLRLILLSKSRGVRFGLQLGQIGTKWNKISFLFILAPPNLTSLPERGNSVKNHRKLLT